jgi:hypothetical protein
MISHALAARLRTAAFRCHACTVLHRFIMTVALAFSAAAALFCLFGWITRAFPSFAGMRLLVKVGVTRLLARRA